MNIKLFINGEYKPESSRPITSVSLESKAQIDCPEIIRLTFSDEMLNLAIPQSQTTKIHLELDGQTTNTFYYAGSYWSYPPGELRVIASGIDFLGSNTGDFGKDETIEKPLKEAFSLIFGNKIEFIIEPSISNTLVNLQVANRNKGEVLDELSRKFGITPIARDGKILFVKDNSPLRKEYIITPSDITRISWADESAKCPSGVSVPYRHPLHYTTLFYTAGNKCAALKVNDFQSSEEDAKRLAENLLREYQSKQYNIALELAKMRCDIKAGSKIKISGLKKSIDKTYILTDVTTSISNKKSVTKLQGIYLNV